MSSLHVKQFRYNLDNFSYLLFGKREAIVIDGGAHNEIKNFIESHNLKLMYLSNTHNHLDHTVGNAHFQDYKNVIFLNHSDLMKLEKIELEGNIINIYQTPGHTSDSVCFHAGKYLISGDTLFNGTIGNCFSGDLRSFYFTIKKIMSLPLDTIIYAGHDYVQDSMNFAMKYEPNNEKIYIMKKKYDYNHVFSELKDEIEVNPYLRFNNENIISILKEMGLPCENELDRWESIMMLE